MALVVSTHTHILGYQIITCVYAKCLPMKHAKYVENRRPKCMRAFHVKQRYMSGCSCKPWCTWQQTNILHVHECTWCAFLCHQSFVQMQAMLRGFSKTCRILYAHVSLVKFKWAVPYINQNIRDNSIFTSSNEYFYINIPTASHGARSTMLVYRYCM